MNKQAALDAVLGLERNPVGLIGSKKKREGKGNEAPMQRCRFCTESIPAVAIRCRYCGSVLGEPLPTQIELTAKRYKAMMAVGKLMLYVGIGLGIWGFNHYLTTHPLMSLLFPFSESTQGAIDPSQYMANVMQRTTQQGRVVNVLPRTQPAPEPSSLFNDVFYDEPLLDVAFALITVGYLVFRCGRGLAWWNNG